MTKLYFCTKNKIGGRADVGEVYETRLVGKYNLHIRNEIHKKYGNIHIANAKYQGYTDQPYAIEILNFEEVDMITTDFNLCIYYNDALICMGYPIKDMRSPTKCRYGDDPNTHEKVILMHITDQELDRMKKSEQQYIFMKRLPKLLRGER